jgi:hypothetical protein
VTAGGLARWVSPKFHGLEPRPGRQDAQHRTVPHRAVQRALYDRSPGRPLDAPLRMNPGIDFSMVRIHTDDTAAELAAGVHADAFTRGTDIYFGAGMYQPRSAAGADMLRHELTHVAQQARGEVSAYAGGVVPQEHPSEASAASGAALTGPVLSSNGSGVTIQRQPAGLTPVATGPIETVTPEGAEHGAPVDQTRIARWTNGPAVVPPELPSPLEITVPEHAPAALGWRPSWQRHDFPARGERPHPVMTMTVEAERYELWRAYRGVVRQAVQAHNALIGPISAYKGLLGADPERARQLVAAGLDPPDRAEAALKREVPRTSRSHVTVGSLFTPAGHGGGTRGQPGLEVQTQGLEEQMGRARRSPNVERLRYGIDAADKKVLAGLLKVKEKVLESEKAGHELAAAAAQVRGFEAAERKKQAEKDLEAAKRSAESAKTWIERGLKVVALMSGALVPLVAIEAASAAAGGEGGGHGGAAETVKSVAESEVTSTIASKIVDLVASSEMSKLAANVEQAEADIREAGSAQVHATEAAAKSGFAASLVAIQEAAAGLEAEMKEREQALMGFGEAIAVASGGSQRAQDRLRGIVQAVPVVESVVAAADNIQAAVQIPPDSDAAGRGLNMSLYAGQDDAYAFLHTVGLLEGYKRRYEGIRDEWNKRLASLRRAIDKMSASDTSGP